MVYIPRRHCWNAFSLDCKYTLTINFVYSLSILFVFKTASALFTHVVTSGTFETAWHKRNEIKFSKNVYAVDIFFSISLLDNIDAVQRLWHTMSRCNDYYIDAMQRLWHMRYPDAMIMTHAMFLYKDYETCGVPMQRLWHIRFHNTTIFTHAM